jgi:hypothetical protein
MQRQADTLRAIRQLVEDELLRLGSAAEPETVAALRTRRTRRGLIGRLVAKKAAGLLSDWQQYIRRWRTLAAQLGEGESMKPVDLSERSYVPEDDRKLPPDEQTTFWIRPIDYPVYVQVLNALARGHGGLSDLSIGLGTQEKIALLAGIVRIDNFKDTYGKLLAWPNGPKDSDEDRLNFLSIIPGKVRSEIASEIRSDGKMDEIQKGESASRSPQQAAGTASAAVKPPNGAIADGA